MAKFKKNEMDNDFETEEVEVETVKMIWIHKKVNPGETGKVFGFPAVGNEQGFFVCDVPKRKVKNEMKRPQTLLLLDVWKKRLVLEEEARNLYE